MTCRLGDERQKLAISFDTAPVSCRSAPRRKPTTFRAKYETRHGLPRTEPTSRQKFVAASEKINLGGVFGVCCSLP
jgi:hypothetical protein